MMGQNMSENKSRMLIYQADDNSIKVDVLLEQETVWLTMDQMSLLFQKSRSTINGHILNIYKEGELEKASTIRKNGNSDFSTKLRNICMTRHEQKQYKEA